MFTTDEQVLSDIAAALKTPVTELQPWWQDVVQRVHTIANQDILGRLIKRGYLESQITQWDRGEEFERDISLYFAFRTPQGVGSLDAESVKTWDRRGELKDILLAIGGVFVAPIGTGTPGTVGVGMQDTSCDHFVLPPGHGRPTRF